jgi:hypothetical protein
MKIGLLQMEQSILVTTETACVTNVIFVKSSLVLKNSGFKV